MPTVDASASVANFSLNSLLSTSLSDTVGQNFQSFLTATLTKQDSVQTVVSTNNSASSNNGASSNSGTSSNSSRATSGNNDSPDANQVVSRQPSTSSSASSRSAAASARNHRDHTNNATAASDPTLNTPTSSDTQGEAVAQPLARQDAANASGTSSVDTTVEDKGATKDDNNSSVQSQIAALQSVVQIIVLTLAPATSTGDTAGPENTASLSGGSELLAATQDLMDVLNQLEQGLQSADGSSQLPLTNDQIQALFQRLEQDVNAIASLLPSDTTELVTTYVSTTDTASASNADSTPNVATAAPVITALASNKTSVDATSNPSPSSTQGVSGQEDLRARLSQALEKLQTTVQTPAPTNDSASQALPPLPATTPVPTTPVQAQKNNTAHDSHTLSSIDVIVGSLPVTAGKISSNDTPTTAVNDTTTQTFTPLSSTFIVQVAQADSKQSDTSGSSGQGQSGAFPLGAVQANSSASSVDTNASFSSALSKASPSSVLDQVSVQIKSLASSGQNKITIQLDPAELGKVDIKLTMNADGKTHVVVTADNSNTLELLQRDSNGLARALADAGLSTSNGSLNFNLRGGGQQQENAASSKSVPYANWLGDSATEEEGAGVTQTYTYRVGAGSVDISI